MDSKKESLWRLLFAQEILTYQLCARSFVYKLNIFSCIDQSHGRLVFLVPDNVYACTSTPNHHFKTLCERKKVYYQKPDFEKAYKVANPMYVNMLIKKRCSSVVAGVVTIRIQSFQESVTNDVVHNLGPVVLSVLLLAFKSNPF